MPLHVTFCLWVSGLSFQFGVLVWAEDEGSRSCSPSITGTAANPILKQFVAHEGPFLCCHGAVWRHASFFPLLACESVPAPWTIVDRGTCFLLTLQQVLRVLFRHTIPWLLFPAWRGASFVLSAFSESLWNVLAGCMFLNLEKYY